MQGSSQTSNPSNLSRFPLATEPSGALLRPLHQALTQNGHSHVIFGKKPIGWLLKDEFTALQSIQNSFQLNENFSIVADNPNGPSAGRGYLINNKNLQELIKNNEGYFSSKFKENDIDILAKKIKEELPNRENWDRKIADKATTFGVLLGYGTENSETFARMMYTNNENLSSLMKATKSSSFQNFFGLSKDLAFRLPPFRGWDTAQSLKILEKNINMAIIYLPQTSLACRMEP